MTIINGDCLEIIKSMEDNSIDFIVTDPPYGLNFMGKSWDKEIPNQDIWKECFRICKPGSMLAAFGGTRTHHHLMIALEKSGWEIRDVIMWLYGSGFPKSHNHFGIPGYGTAIKPAYEPIIIAMKKLDGTFAQNFEKWGLAGINIHENRIKVTDEDAKSMERVNTPGSGRFKSGKFGSSGKDGFGDKNGPYNTKIGRWPANIILDEESAKKLDHLSNGASRFFYCAKPSYREKNQGLDEIPEKNHHPTVKPIALMKYIIKLLAPPNNPILLDPFAGSGSTLIAAKELGINFIGIEKESEYYDIAISRLNSIKILSEQLSLNI